MNIAVFGLFRNEKYLFPIWYKYYSEQVGSENVYIYDDCTIDGTFDNFDLKNYEKLDLKRRFSVETKRLGVGDYNTLWNFIVQKYIELLEKYDYVINADADDFIVANPEKYKNLKELLKDRNSDWFRCKAYEVLQLKNEKKIDWSKKILKQRTQWIRVSNLDKTSVTKIRLDFNGEWTVGNHYVYKKQNESAFDDLLLIHLHRIDYDMYKEKYFIEDNTIKSDKDFLTRYGGYPLFWRKEKLDIHFYEPAANLQFGAAKAKSEKIPNMYKEIL